MNQQSDNIYRIRLKGPWEVRFVTGDVADSTRFEKIHVPIAWRDAFGDRSGAVCFKRRFHAPTGLGHHDQVNIRVPEGAGHLRDFRINNIPLLPQHDAALTFAVTDHLEAFSEIQFTLDFDPNAEPETPGGLWEAVLLEIVTPPGIKNH